MRRHNSISPRAFGWVNSRRRVWHSRAFEQRQCRHASGCGNSRSAGLRRSSRKVPCSEVPRSQERSATASSIAMVSNTWATGWPMTIVAETQAHPLAGAADRVRARRYRSRFALLGFRWFVRTWAGRHICGFLWRWRSSSRWLCSPRNLDQARLSGLCGRPRHVGAGAAHWRRSARCEAMDRYRHDLVSAVGTHEVSARCGIGSLLSVAAGRSHRQSFGP